MLGEVAQGVNVLVSGLVLPVAEGKVVLARQGLDPLKEFLGQHSHAGIGECGVGRRSVDVILTIGNGDGGFDRSDAASDKDFFGFVVGKNTGKLSNIGEAVDLSVSNPSAKVVKIETCGENGVLNV